MTGRGLSDFRADAKGLGWESVLMGQCYKRATGLIEAGVGDDLVALEVRTGDCFGFNEVAAAVWRSLSEPKSFERLRRELMSDYEVSPEECSARLQELLDDLVEKRLVIIDTQEG